MKTIVIVLLLLISGVANANTISVSLADAAWDGIKIPSGQQCEKFFGQGATPRIAVQQIPGTANAIVMEYSDRSYQAMDHGGHGKFGYRIPSASSSIVIPSLMGHSFELPHGFFLIQAQRAPTWDKAGAYLPPCSGGKGNDYYVTVKAVREVNGEIQEVLQETELFIGKY